MKTISDIRDLLLDSMEKVASGEMNATTGIALSKMSDSVIRTAALEAQYYQKFGGSLGTLNQLMDNKEARTSSGSEYDGYTCHIWIDGTLYDGVAKVLANGMVVIDDHNRGVSPQVDPLRVNIVKGPAV